ncbi:hypothetical protein SPHINGOT1_130117 [Sphingomonas sp. T1]|nr:hypothetical protein SPHINGOT1_130117 [Sphingomonas sp. T1]
MDTARSLTALAETMGPGFRGGDGGQ